MPKSATVSPDQKSYETITTKFVSAAVGVTRAQMMGMPCLKVNE